MAQIKLESKIVNDKYTEYVYDTFDIQNKDVTTTILEANFSSLRGTEWNIGVIYGSSGSGKTTILNKIGKVKNIQFDNEKSLISNFYFLEPDEACILLSSMGLYSVPSWLRPYHLLSNGEKYRAELAYIVGKSFENEYILIDEFTSVVDRDVAKAMAFSLSKYIRKHNKKIILCSCHYDIMEWLNPDWILSPQKNMGIPEWYAHRQSTRPNIELSVYRVEADTWEIFKKHHYLTEALNKSAKCFLFTWNDKPVGFIALLNSPRNGMPNAFSLSRTVVLPDYQGMGIGSKISEFIAAIVKNSGGRTFTKTINPALGIYRNNSTNWRGTKYNGKMKNEKDFDTNSYRNRLSRTSYCHEYIGEAIDGYNELLLPIADMRKKQKVGV
jgi:ABC-type lipoprotein export system ATPase subunit/GNAT superfamily N-acetyltransferase